jgi:hypothetical protein
MFPSPLYYINIVEMEKTTVELDFLSNFSVTRFTPLGGI